MIWKLPEHLEAFRGFISVDCFESIEQACNYHGFDIVFHPVSVGIKSQVALLQRLYDAGKLKGGAK